MFIRNILNIMEKTMICPFCGETIKKQNPHHMNKCINNYVENLSQDFKNKIYQLYVVEEKSLLELSKIFKIKYCHLQKILPKIGIIFSY